MGITSSCFREQTIGAEMDQQREVYRQEAYELLGELEGALLALEVMPDDIDLIGRVFRALHTIKGSGAMFGFDEIAAFTHEVETVFDLVRDHKMLVGHELINLALAARDLILEMLDPAYEDTAEVRQRADDLVASIKKLIPSTLSAGGGKALVSGSGADTAEGTALMVTYRIRFRPGKDIFKTGNNPLMLIAELCDLGEASVTAYMEALPPLDEMDPEACYTYWDIILTTDRGENAIRDVFIFVEDFCGIDIRVVDVLTDRVGETDEQYKKLGEILVDRGDLSGEAVKHTLNRQKRVGEMLLEEGLVDREKVESAIVEQEHVRKIRKKRNENFTASSIRVDSEKLDTMVDLVGELVTVQARLTQKAAGQNDPDLLLIAEEVERLSAELRDHTMSVRMLPIGTTFVTFNRLVRDLASELRKEIVLTTEGSETELDKTVIEQLKDPLVHIIRNSIDHGIESPDARVAAGKPRTGTVHLSAGHSGASVLIRISDDGAGLDRDAIFNKGVEKGIISADAQLSESEVYNLIFEPGFSTAKAVTGISGRGVGMDVVKRSIESLRGSIDIKSRRGSGTTITLKLPLTLAIIDGLMVKVGDGSYVLPLSAVVECVELSREEVELAGKRGVMNIRGEVVPYLRLRELFRELLDAGEIEQVVVAESGGTRVGLGVDGVIGQHQTVIKSLGKLYQGVRGTSGATILGDGSVALILDLMELITVSERLRRGAG